MTELIENILPAFAIRSASTREMDECVRLARENWGDESATRCFDQFVAGIEYNPYAPQFFVATIGLYSRVIGFVAVRRSMLMYGFWELIWVAVNNDFKGQGVGEMLVDYALDVVRENDGTSVVLVTQIPKFFNKFGFLTDRDHGNDWNAMSCQLKPADMK